MKWGDIREQHHGALARVTFEDSDGYFEAMGTIDCRAEGVVPQLRYGGKKYLFRSIASVEFLP